MEINLYDGKIARIPIYKVYSFLSWIVIAYHIWITWYRGMILQHWQKDFAKHMAWGPAAKQSLPKW